MDKKRRVTYFPQTRLIFTYFPLTLLHLLSVSVRDGVGRIGGLKLKTSCTVNNVGSLRVLNLFTDNGRVSLCRANIS